MKLFTWCLIFVLVVLVIIIKVYYCCPSPRAHLILEHDDTGDWITIANTFSWNKTGSARCTIPLGPGQPDSVLYRPGILIQAGYYSHSYYKLGTIELYTHGSVTPTRTYSSIGNDRVWINVVSTYDKHLAEPIAPNDAFYLYPNYGDFAPQTCHPDSFKVPPTCFRNRTIDPSLTQVTSILTYWQGSGGFGVAARQTKNDCSGNEFRFTFEDDFRVDVYRPDDWTHGTKMVLEDAFAVGVVDSIRVLLDTTGPTGDDTQPLPWDVP